MTNVVEYEKKYPEHLVVMQNKILQAYHQMSLDEKRLIVLASPIARVIDATEKDAITITAEDFAKATDIQTNSAYKQLEQASKTMMQRQFSYKNEKGKRVNVQWIIRSVYDDGQISLCFTDEVLYMLKVFDKNNPFTKYEKQEVLKLKRDYSIDLYHIFKKRQNTNSGNKKGVFDITLDEIKTELGLSKSYDRINNLKARVLEPSVNEINEKTDIEVSYDNLKKGRTVIALRFTVKSKKSSKQKEKDIDRDPDTPDLFHEMTEKQISYFSAKLANDANFGSKYAKPGEDLRAFEQRIKDELRHIETQQKWASDLKRVGFEPKK